MQLEVTINGTDSNPWHKWNLRQNPFPQIAKAELEGAMRELNSLDGDPITKPETEIPERLKGWAQEFIDLCISQYKKGERVRFSVSFPEA